MPDLTQITSPSGVKFTVAKDAADAFSGFLADLEGAGYKIDQKTSGGYNDRNIAGTNTPSQHSFGRAIDINPAANARGAKTSSDLPANVNDIAAAHGLTWGGTWSGDTRDPMHFELSGKPAVADTGPSADDLLKRMDRLAPAAGAGGGAAAGAAPASAQDEGPSGDDLLRRMEGLAPAPPPAAAPGPTPRFDDYGRPLPSPTSDTNKGLTLSDVQNMLAPAPNTEYGNILPYAKDPTTGDIRWLAKDPKTGATIPLPVMPNLLRGGLAMVPAAVSAATHDLSEMMTADPTTGGFGTTPEGGAAINLLTGFGARPTGFSRPLSAVPLAEREAAAAGKPPPEAPAPAPDGAPGVAQPAVRLSPEDQRWVAGTQQHVNEILAANKAAGIPGDLSAAATPAELAKLTPGQMKAYRRQAELGDILAPPEPGVDRNIYVDGSEPTKAEWSGDPVEAQKERLLRQRDPTSYDARLKQNTDARVRSYENMEGTNIEVNDLRRAKDVAAERDGNAFLKAAQPLDMQPQLDWLNTKMTDLRVMENPDAMKVLGDLKASLFDASGQLKTDPSSGWGMHDNMINRLDKANDRNSAERYAKSLLTEYKQVVDGVNNTASDGAFQKFLDNQSSYAQQINVKTLLQDFRPRLTNTKGDINISAFHKFVVDLAKRRGNRGVDPAMDIPDETMRGLINIDKDLKRSTNIDLGTTRGSETNLFYALAQGMGLGAAHLGMAAMTAGSPVANIVLQGGLNLAGKLSGNVLLRRNVRRGLSPPPEGYSYNPLQEP